MARLKTYLVGSPSLRDHLCELIPESQVEIVGESNAADRAEAEIVRLQPDVIIQAANECEGDSFLLLQNIKRTFPETSYIVLGDILDPMFRIRYSSTRANLVLDRHTGWARVLGLLKTMISDLNSTRFLSDHDPVRVANNPNGKPDCDRLFSLMDKCKICLMFADQDSVLRHVNSSALIAFKPLEKFFPEQIERMTGKPLVSFHRGTSLVGKVINDPRNLPHATQLIIGPKIFDLNVRPVYDEHQENRIGLIARWSELSETALLNRMTLPKD